MRSRVVAAGSDPAPAGHRHRLDGGRAGSVLAAWGALRPTLGRLAAEHEVQVVLYARPQNTALEARWRQWGYLVDEAPSSWVAGQADHLRHRRTGDGIARMVPDVAFTVRPFRRDLLVGGDVITDFAQTALDLDVPLASVAGLDENPSLPLDLAIMLRGAPTDALGTGRDGGRLQWKVGRIAREWSVPPSPQARRSQELLAAFARQEFEADNRALIAELGWETASFVPDDLGTDRHPNLAELDEMWSPSATATEISYTARALPDLAQAPGRPGQSSGS